ncbi:MAG: glycine zipper family protein [Chloroflexota bacterium]
MTPNNPPSFQNIYKILGLLIGLTLGGFVGLQLDIPAVFAGGGLVLGLAIGTAIDNKIKIDMS